MNAPRLFGILGAASAFLSIAAGAFGAHALRTRIPANLVEIFETAARYQMYHALALVGLASLLGRAPHPAFLWAGWLFVTGTVIFSGSLYALALTGVRTWGAVTPIGGVAFLGGWLLVLWGFVMGAR